MEHPSLIDIMRYVAGRMAEEEAFHLETHIGRCADCAVRVRTHRVFRDHRAALFAARPRTTPVGSRLRKRIRAFAGDSDLPTDLKRRLVRWSRDLFTSTRAALRIGIESAKGQAWILPEGVPLVSHGRALLAFAPVPQPIRVRGKGLNAPAVVESSGEPPTRVVADAAEGAVIVRHPKGAPPHPLVLLISSCDERIQSTEMAVVPGEPYLIARFDNVPDGEYTLLVQAQPAPTA